MNKSTLLVIAFFLVMTPLSLIIAQTENLGSCGTVITERDIERIQELQPQFEYYEQEYFEKLSNRTSTAITDIPVKAHIIRTSAGTGGLSETDLNDAIANMNAYYANAFMNFYLCDGINYIDSDTFYDYETNEEAALTSANSVAGLINIYFAPTVTSSSSGGGLCGYAYLPGGPDTILMANPCATNGSTLPHEVGHFFNLLHTHGPSNSTLTTELVNGSNCDTDGDFICDTPADPQLSSANVNPSCVYTGTTTDSNGDTFVPDPTNIMSYSRKPCRTYFSPGQYARMYAAYHTTRNYFECPSFNADMTSSFTRDCSESLEVTFTDTSVGATSWEWDVDGDDVVDYTIPNPVHTYSPGVYDVTLTVSDGTNSLTRVFANHIDFETNDIFTTQIHLELLTDNWCEETTWALKDEAGNTLYSGGPYTANVEDNTLFNYSFDVNLDECYIFEINDSYGDGICCSQGPGYYELTLDDDSVVASGGAFGFGETTYMVNQEALSLDENVLESFSVYPNPTSNKLTVNLRNNNYLPDNFTIYNMLGQVVSRSEINGFEDLTIDVSQFRDGVYYLKLRKDNAETTIPFIKQ